MWWNWYSQYEESTPGTFINTSTSPWICHLMLGELLGKDGKEFIRWSTEELTAWGKVAYHSRDNTFMPMLADGTNVEGYVCKEDGPLGLKGTSLESVPLGPTHFWAYALAYCLTADGFMWEMARSIAIGNDYGDLGAICDEEPRLNLQTDITDPYVMWVFLELHRRLGKRAFLEMAQRIGGNILAHRFYKGFVAPSSQHTFTKLDCIDTLVLLHLYAAVIDNSSTKIQKVWPATPWVEYPYRGKDQMTDNKIIYTLKEMSEPPKSLQEAAAEGNLEMVRSIIAKGTAVDHREDGFRKTALVRAVINGHRDVVELTLTYGADVNAKMGFPGGTALHFAAEKGYREIAMLLIAQGADVNAERSTPLGDTPLHSAVRTGQKDIVDLLVNAGADITVKNGSGQTPLDIALQRNRKDMVGLLISKGAKVSIHVIVRFGDAGLVRDFLEKGADVNVKDSDGKTALDIAMDKYNQKIAKLLIAKGAEASIQAAAFVGNIKKVRDFLERGGSVDTVDASGQTLLHLAAAGNHRDIAALLVSKGADVNAFADWMTPLGSAARAGSIDVAEYLIAQGANVNGREGSWTPLQEAAGYSKEMVELLFNKGADINAGKWTALHHALNVERFDIVELLIDRGVDVNIKDGQGRTPLHIAAWYAASNNPKIVELLLSKGADINAKANNGKTALSYAVRGGHAEILEILRKHGAKED